MSNGSFTTSIANQQDELQYILTPLRIQQAALLSDNFLYNERVKPGGKVDVIAWILTFLTRGRIVHAVWDAPGTIMGHRSTVLKGAAEFRHHHLVLQATEPHPDEYTIRVPDERSAEVLRTLFVDKVHPFESAPLTVAVCVDRPGANGKSTREVVSKTVRMNRRTMKVEIS